MTANLWPHYNLSMERIVDLHTHLELLQDIFSLRNKLQGHLYSLEGHIKENTKCLLGVALYVQVYQNYDDLILQIKTIKNEINKFGDDVRLITKKADLEGDYKVGIILHIESARILTNPKVQLPKLWEMGVRGITPLHFTDNHIGNSCDDPLRRVKIKKTDSGLTTQGVEFIKLMNELGMFVDLSHTMDTTADQILELANEVMVSHVSIRDNVPKLRNKSIDFLKKVAAKGGIFGLIPWQHLVGTDENGFQKSLETAIDYGLDHSACFGTDMGAPIKTHENIKSVFDLAAIADKYPEHAEKVKWENAYHFFERVLPD